MFCTKCGKQSQDGDLFCEHCGARLRTGVNAATAAPTESAHTPPPAQPVPPPPPRPVYNQPRTSAPPKRPRSEYEQRVKDAFVEKAKSPLFLISVIFFSLSILFSLMDSMSATASITQMLDMFSELGIPMRELEDALSGIQSAGFGFALVTSAPSILTVIGLWMVYAGGHSNAGSNGSTGGLTVLTVSQYISLAGTGLAFLLGFGVLFGACSTISQAQSRYSSSSYYYSSSRSDALGAAQGAIFFTMLILLATGAFMAWYISRILTTINNVKNTAETGVADSDVSVFVGVMCFIGGGCSVLSFNLSGLLSGVALIMFGVQLFMYRSTMSELESLRYQYDFGPSVLTSAYQRSQSQGQVPAWKRVEMQQVAQPQQSAQPVQNVQTQPEQKVAEETPVAESDTQE